MWEWAVREADQQHIRCILLKKKHQVEGSKRLQEQYSLILLRQNLADSGNTPGVDVAGYRNRICRVMQDTRGSWNMTEVYAGVRMKRDSDGKMADCNFKLMTI